MSPDHAEFAQWDASYVMGALTPGDRRAYEAHLEECERCRVAVGELASMPGLLARARPEVETWDGQEEVAGPPANLVDLVTERRARRARSIRNRVILAASGVAAVVVLAIAVPAFLTSDAVPARAEVVALAPVGDSTMTVSLGFTPVAWGTRIAITCDYPAGETYGPWSYSLELTDVAGKTSQVASWKAVAGETIHLEAATAIPLNRIASVRVLSSDGAAVLSGTVLSGTVRG
jgi:Putative zinc-finger